MFWTDFEQARQRLTRSCVMYGDEPVEIVDVYHDRENRGNIKVLCSNSAHPERSVDIEDDQWHNFRRLPSLGFVNTPRNLFRLTRVPTPTVKHGLTSDNTMVSFLATTGDWRRADTSVSRLVVRREHFEFYQAACQGAYPSYAQALDTLANAEEADLDRNRAIAFSPFHYLYRSPSGIIEVWRERNQIGMVLNNNLLLTKKFVCFREELAEKYEIPNVMEA